MGLFSSRRYRASPLYGPTVVEPAVQGRVGVAPVAPTFPMAPPPVTPMVSPPVIQTPMVPYGGLAAGPSTVLPYRGPGGLGFYGRFGANVGSYGGGVGFGMGVGSRSASGMMATPGVVPYTTGFGYNTSPVAPVASYSTSAVQPVTSYYQQTSSQYPLVQSQYMTPQYMTPVPTPAPAPTPVPTCDSESYVVTIR